LFDEEPKQATEIWNDVGYLIETTGIYSGSGGAELKMQLNEMSFILIIITGITGYVGTILWWNSSDQK
jgi:hypothetical protein